MCTLALAWQVLADGPIAVAANRDEQLDRAARSPGPFASDPAVVAPTDREAGGTWIGLNEHGVVTGILNRWAATGLDAERSRGRLVADVLACHSTDEAVTLVTKQLETIEYDGFFLIIADAAQATCIGWDGTVSVESLEPGVHVAVNVGLDGAADEVEGQKEDGERMAENATNLRSALTPTDGETIEGWLDRGGRALGDHEFGVCIHRNEFGTRSSSLIGLGPSPTYAFADGPPCQTPYEAVDLEGHL